MFKAMFIDNKNCEGDELAGYFESEEVFIEFLKDCTKDNRNIVYAGTEMYAGKKCYLVRNRPEGKYQIKDRYYLEKLQNGWV